ncbi:MAG TPA: T9SS type A sorting domain-containing protein, partial [Ferruginibacter sp.]|nr:T9SS type A sorting domain-containing protein [Ferruginibacter sp.]
NLGTLTIAHNNNAGGTWDAIGTTGVTSGNATSGSVTWNGTQSASFGAFAIGSTNFQNPLPFTINYFRGVKLNREHQLNWYLSCYSTPSVTMSLERSSDQRTYRSLHTIFATAQDCQQPFGFRDIDPAPGINHYRLKITDADGRVSYSPVVSLINADKGLDIQPITPNPVTGSRFNVRISSAKALVFELHITDIQGRVVHRQRLNLVAGFNENTVDVSRLPAGTYQVYGLANGERTKLMRFVK